MDVNNLCNGMPASAANQRTKKCSERQSVNARSINGDADEKAERNTSLPKHSGIDMVFAAAALCRWSEMPLRCVVIRLRG
jgi:hypothetical protein